MKEKYKNNGKSSWNKKYVLCYQFDMLKDFLPTWIATFMPRVFFVGSSVTGKSAIMKNFTESITKFENPHTIITINTKYENNKIISYFYIPNENLWEKIFLKSKIVILLINLKDHFLLQRDLSQLGSLIMFYLPFSWQSQ